MTGTPTDLSSAALLDPFASRPDDLVRVRLRRPDALDDLDQPDVPAGGGEVITRTEHFRLRRNGRRLEVDHWLPGDQLDNDLAGLIAEELFGPGWLSGNDLFERVFTGVVRSTAADPMQAWNAFYDNTMAAIRRHLARPSPVPGAACSEIANMAPVYGRALRLVPPGRVLDLGSCFGFFPLLLAEAGRHSVLASDLVAGTMRLLSAVARNRKVPLRTLTCDATSVPLPDAAFDTVTVLHLLEHLDPEQGSAVLAEAMRLATRSVVIAVPFEDEPAAVYGHVRRFDIETLTALGKLFGRRFTVAEHHGGWLVIRPGAR
ncbi:MAG TPA: mycofactocin oligosaccharide methyltransferase MftM [Pseudonocardiaceae bacterium]|jgi:SAM-dependent methyltransferase